MDYPDFLRDVLAIAVACQDTDVRNVKALIVGPPDTPYEFGFFEVRPYGRLHAALTDSCSSLLYSQRVPTLHAKPEDFD